MIKTAVPDTLELKEKSKCFVKEGMLTEFMSPASFTAHLFHLTKHGHILYSVIQLLDFMK